MGGALLGIGTSYAAQQTPWGNPWSPLGPGVPGSQFLGPQSPLSGYPLAAGPFGPSQVLQSLQAALQQLLHIQYIQQQQIQQLLQLTPQQIHQLQHLIQFVAQQVHQTYQQPFAAGGGFPSLGAPSGWLGATQGQPQGFGAQAGYVM